MSFPIEQVLQLFDHLCGPLSPLQCVHVFFEWCIRGLGTVLQVWPDKCCLDWHDHNSISASYAPWMQPRIQFAFLAKCGLMLSCPPRFQVPFAKAPPQTESFQPVLETLDTPFKGHNLFLVFVKLQTALSIPLFQPVQVSL